jgi:rod shape-determining protein MreC
MPSTRTRTARRIVPVVLILVAVALITLSVRAEGRVGDGAARAADAQVAAQEAARRVTQPVRDLITWFGDLRTARAESERLAAENALLRADLARLQAQEQDVEELRGLLGYVQSPDFPRIEDYAPRAARVVARSPSLTSSTVVVDAGEAAGVRVGDPVLAGVADAADVGGAALVGRVETVTDGTATVALLSNASVAVGAAVAGRRGADGILQPSAADPSVLVLGFVRRASVVRTGDRVVTSGFIDPASGLGSAYPRGLPIGVVSEARQSDTDTYKNVLVVPWVELGSFANVVVLTRAEAAP